MGRVRIEIKARVPRRIGAKHIVTDDQILSDLVASHTIESKVGEPRMVLLSLYVNGSFGTEDITISASREEALDADH
jgi:hypothetical protein